MAGRKYVLYDTGKLAISIAPNSTTTYSAVEADYVLLKVDPFLVPTPTPELVRSTAVGTGSGYSQPEDDRLYRWPGDIFTIGGPLDINAIKYLVRRAFGGTSTNVVVTATTSWDHDFDFLASTVRDPIFSHIIVGNDTEQFVYRVAINNFTITQGGNNRPTWSAELHATHWAKVSDVAGLDLATVPAQPTPQFMHGAALLLTYNDGSAIDLTTAADDRRIIEMSLGVNNALGRQGFPGDPMRTSGDNASGVIDSGIMRGDLRQVQSGLVNIKVFPETDIYREFDKMIAQTIGTNLIFRWRSENKINATDWYELAFTYPKWKYDAVQPETQGTPAGEMVAKRLPLTVYPDASDFLVHGRIRDNAATLV